MLYSSLYDDAKRKWDLVSDCYSGTDAVKYGKRSDVYLPLSKPEREEVERYQTRHHYEFRKVYANYENLLRPTVDDAVGIMQKNAAKVSFGIEHDEESPPEVIDLNIYGNKYNDGLFGLKQRLNFNQCLFGRYGLLLDVVTDSQGLLPRFSISEYPAWSIINGETSKTNSGTSAVIWAALDETTLVFDKTNKLWKKEARIRVVGLDDNGEYYQALLKGDDALSQWASFDLGQPVGDEVVYPMFKGNRLNFVPLTVCNCTNIGLENWQQPPFLDVAHTSLALYRKDSLYSKALWNHASPTLVIKGHDQKEGLSAGGTLWLYSSRGEQVDASLLETSGSGLAEMRNAKQELRQSLKYTNLRELLDGAGAGSSGEAISLRSTSGTAAIAAMDQTGARAIEEQLCFASMWAGATSEEAGKRINYKADTSYLSTDIQLANVVQLMAGNQTADGGRPFLSSQNMYSLIAKAAPGVLSSYEDNEQQKEMEVQL
jgi:hypothetical protein